MQAADVARSGSCTWFFLLSFSPNVFGMSAGTSLSVFVLDDEVVFCFLEDVVDKAYLFQEHGSLQFAVQRTAQTDVALCLKLEWRIRVTSTTVSTYQVLALVKIQH